MSSFMVVGDIDLPIVIEFIGGSHFFVLIEVYENWYMVGTWKVWQSRVKRALSLKSLKFPSS